MGRSCADTQGRSPAPAPFAPRCRVCLRRSKARLGLAALGGGAFRKSFQKGFLSQTDLH